MITIDIALAMDGASTPDRLEDGVGGNELHFRGLTTSLALVAIAIDMALHSITRLSHL